MKPWPLSPTLRLRATLVIPATSSTSPGSSEFRGSAPLGPGFLWTALHPHDTRLPVSTQRQAC